MDNLIDYALKEKYEKVKELKSKFFELKNIIDWNSVSNSFKTDYEYKTGRPPYEKKLMIQILFLQNCYNISDEELEYQLYNRLDFQAFLDYPKKIPDYSTIWRFREELTEKDYIELIWNNINEQIKSKGIEISKGKIQDASFVHAEPGKTNSGMKNRGREAKTSRNKDGSWTKKGNKSIFGYKTHLKVDDKTKLISEMALSTAKTYDGKIDLAENDEIIYRDKCYSGSNTKAKGNASMKKGKLSIKQELRNKRITKKRCRGEHPLGTMHRSFKAGTTKLTTLARVFVQQVFVGIVYNLHRLKFLLS